MIRFYKDHCPGKTKYCTGRTRYFMSNTFLIFETIGSNVFSVSCKFILSEAEGQSCTIGNSIQQLSQSL